jgi:hypothetical protein
MYSNLSSKFAQHSQKIPIYGGTQELNNIDLRRMIMDKKKIVFSFCSRPVLSVLLFVFLTGHPALALEMGKTYDKTNYQEIQDLLPPPLLAWLQKGIGSIKIGPLKADWGKYESKFMQQTAANKGKYKIASNQLLLDSASGQLAKYAFGFPFPEIDLKDPNAGQMIMENAQACREHCGTTSTAAIQQWINENQMEREITACALYFYYFQRLDGEVENPNNYRKLSISNVLAPFDLRGTSSMNLEYLDERENTNFAYVPMLRRVRRTSAAATSDPVMGSDICPDDAMGWGGKNFWMDWKFLGEKTILCMLPPDTSATISTPNPDGSINKTDIPIKAGYEVPGWKGAAYFPADITAVPRECYMVEGNPHDPYYNYGKQIFYVDKVGHNIWYKQVYDRSGQYWKTVNIVWSKNEAGDRWMAYDTPVYPIIDDKTNHSTWARILSYPSFPTFIHGKTTPDQFTTNYLQQMSK